ncbi:MAG: transporter [Betaproteobacteria bacterium]|nr:transporter [Betaproteobacteria bacterium]
MLVSSTTVGDGRLHIEAGVNFEQDRRGILKSRAWTTPVALRYGIGDDLELRLESDAYTRQREGGTGAAGKQSGYADAALGIKWRDRNADAAKGTAATAWWLSVELPSGSRDFKGDGTRPALYRVMEWALSEDDGVALMPGIKYDRDVDGYFWSGALAGSYARRLNDRLGVAVALEGKQLAGPRHGGNVVSTTASLAYLLDKDSQIDTGVSFGLNEHSPDFAWTAGLSVRF